MKCCVYLHKKKDTGEVFYVGSGSIDRSKKFSNRTLEWKSIANKHGVDVVIVASGLSKKDSLKLESKLLYEYPNLVNKVPVFEVKTLNFEHLNSIFKLNPLSPSYLSWNISKPRIRLGQHAGTIAKKKNKQYWQICVEGKLVYAHRIVYILVNGSIDEELVIDHIDGNGLNNSPLNLQQVSHAINSANIRIKE